MNEHRDCRICGGVGGWLSGVVGDRICDDGDASFIPCRTDGLIRAVPLPVAAVQAADAAGVGRQSVEWARAWRRALRRLASAGEIPAAAAALWSGSAAAAERARAMPGALQGFFDGGFGGRRYAK